jgi:hypothetical protein
MWMITMMAKLTEVLRAKAEQRRAVELGIAADEVVYAGMERPADGPGAVLDVVLPVFLIDLANLRPELLIAAEELAFAKIHFFSLDRGWVVVVAPSRGARWRLPPKELAAVISPQRRPRT